MPFSIRIFPFFICKCPTQIIHPHRGPRDRTGAYWLAHPLKKHLPLPFRKPSAEVSPPPPYIKTCIDTLTMLFDSGLLTSSSTAPHRAIYQHLISSKMQQGRTENARPELDWSSIWRWVAKIRVRDGELVCVNAVSLNSGICN